MIQDKELINKKGKLEIIQDIIIEVQSSEEKQQKNITSSEEDEPLNKQKNWADQILAKDLQKLEMDMVQTPPVMSTGKFLKQKTVDFSQELNSVNSSVQNTGSYSFQNIMNDQIKNANLFTQNPIEQDQQNLDQFKISFNNEEFNLNECNENILNIKDELSINPNHEVIFKSPQSNYVNITDENASLQEEQIQITAQEINDPNCTDLKTENHSELHNNLTNKINNPSSDRPESQHSSKQNFQKAESNIYEKFFRAEANEINIKVLQYQRENGWLKFEIENNDVKVFLKDGKYVTSLKKQLGAFKYQKQRRYNKIDKNLNFQKTEIIDENQKEEIDLVQEPKETAQGLQISDHNSFRQQKKFEENDQIQLNEQQLEKQDDSQCVSPQKCSSDDLASEKIQFYEYNQQIQDEDRRFEQVIETEDLNQEIPLTNEDEMQEQNNFYFEKEGQILHSYSGLEEIQQQDNIDNSLDQSNLPLCQSKFEQSHSQTEETFLNNNAKVSIDLNDLNQQNDGCMIETQNLNYDQHDPYKDERSDSKQKLIQIQTNKELASKFNYQNKLINNQITKDNKISLKNRSNFQAKKIQQLIIKQQDEISEKRKQLINSQSEQQYDYYQLKTSEHKIQDHLQQMRTITRPKLVSSSKKRITGFLYKNSNKSVNKTIQRDQLNGSEQKENKLTKQDLKIDNIKDKDMSPETCLNNSSKSLMKTLFTVESQKLISNIMKNSRHSSIQKLKIKRLQKTDQQSPKSSHQNSINVYQSNQYMKNKKQILSASNFGKRYSVQSIKTNAKHQLQNLSKFKELQQIYQNNQVDFDPQQSVKVFPVTQVFSNQRQSARNLRRYEDTIYSDQSLNLNKERKFYSRNDSRLNYFTKQSQNSQLNQLNSKINIVDQQILIIGDHNNDLSKKKIKSKMIKNLNQTIQDSQKFNRKLKEENESENQESINKINRIQNTQKAQRNLLNQYTNITIQKNEQHNLLSHKNSNTTQYSSVLQKIPIYYMDQKNLKKEMINQDAVIENILQMKRLSNPLKPIKLLQFESINQQQKNVYFKEDKEITQQKEEYMNENIKRQLKRSQWKKIIQQLESQPQCMMEMIPSPHYQNIDCSKKLSGKISLHQNLIEQQGLKIQGLLNKQNILRNKMSPLNMNKQKSGDLIFNQQHQDLRQTQKQRFIIQQQIQNNFK